MGPVFDPVRLQPLLFRRGAHKAFKVAPRVQSLPTPVRRRQEGRLHLRPVHRTGLVIVVVQGMGETIASQVAPIRCQFLVGESFGAAHWFSRRAAAAPPAAQAVLDRLHLHVIPVHEESAQYPPMVRSVPIVIGRALPDAHRGQVRRLECSNLPLVDGVVRNTIQTDFTVAPRLYASPFDAAEKVPGLTRREMVDVAGRAPTTPAVDADHRVVIRYPLLGIDYLPRSEEHTS